MARRRDRKGRFVSGGRRRRGRGLSSIITVRRSLGALSFEDFLPVLVGGSATALTALGIRYFVDPNGGTTQQMLVKWANLFGVAVGGLASAMMFLMSGSGAATTAFLTSGVVGGFGLLSDFVMKERAAPILAAIASSGAAAMPPAGVEGLRAIVPEYANGMHGLNALVMEQMGPGGRRPGSLGSYGEVVSLQGVNVGAFGTSPFRA